MAQFLFSTGKLSIAPFGVAFDGTHVVGAIQNAEFSHSFEVKEMREAASINLFPVDNVSFDASAMLKFDAGDIAEALIVYATGATKSTGGGNNVYTGSTTAVPPYVKIKFEGKLTDGRAATLEIARSRNPTGMTLATKRDDYTQFPAEYRVYPVDAAATPWTLTIAI